MTDIALDKSHDLLIINGKLGLVPSKEILLQQKLSMKLRTFTNTLWTNINYGINVNLIFKKNTKELLDSNIIQLILSTEGVEEIVSFESRTSDKRIYTCDFQIKVTTGAILNLSGFSIGFGYYNEVDYNIWKDGKYQYNGSWSNEETWGSR